MLSHFFIDRPIFSVVVSLVISIAGLVAMVNLPIAQFPQITPIQIQVTATYPGANGTLVAQNVGCAHRAEGERRQQHDLHAVDQLVDRQLHLDRLLHHRHRPDAGAGGRAEPVEPGDAAAAAIGSGARRHRATEDQHLPHGAGVLLARRALRHGLHLQLHQRSDPQHDQPHRRRQPGIDIRRPGLCDAHLAEAGSDGAARHHHHRHLERREGAEPAVRGWPHRRFPDPLPGEADVSGHHPNHHRTRTVRQHDPARREPTGGARARERRRIRRPRPEKLRVAHKLPGEAGDPDRHLPAAWRERH